MSALENIDKAISDLINSLLSEFGKTFQTNERKAEIVKEIATLRASMNPQCNCQK